MTHKKLGIVLMSFFFALAICLSGGNALAELLDAEYYTAGDLVSTATQSTDYVEFGTKMASSDGRAYKVAYIGDSHGVNKYMLETLQTRLDNPATYACDIPGPYDFYVQTYGLGGYTTQGIWEAMEQANYAAGASVVLVMAGTNDLTNYWYNHYDSISWENQLNNMVNNMKRIVERIADPNSEGRPRIVVASAPPSLDANISALAMDYNAALQNALTDYVDVFVQDNFNDLWNYDTNSVRTELMRDNVHPNNDGNYRIAENWLQGITSLWDENIFTKYPGVIKMPDYRDNN